MDDRELLELAALAAEIPLKPDFVERYDYYMADPLMWNPLTDDGDALRLAVKLRIVPACGDESASVYCNQLGGHWCLNNKVRVEDDPCAATRRAITRAAAEIGKTMNTPAKSPI